MNRSAEQTNRPRTASRFTRFVCPALRFIPHEPRKKDTHSLIEKNLILLNDSAGEYKILFEKVHSFNDISIKDIVLCSPDRKWELRLTVVK